MEADCQAYILAKERTSGTMWGEGSQQSFRKSDLVGGLILNSKGHHFWTAPYFVHVRRTGFFSLFPILLM